MHRRDVPASQMEAPKPLILTILEYFTDESFQPSVGIYKAPQFAYWDRAEVQRTVAQISDPNQRFFNEKGDIVEDLRLLEKDPDTAFRNATYRVTPFGARKRDELREKLGLQPA